MKTIKSRGTYWALLCDCGKWDAMKPMVCGVLASYKEAVALKKEVENCPAKHKIVKCSLTITYE